MNRKLTIPQLCRLCDHATLRDCDGYDFRLEAAGNALGLIRYDPACDEGPCLLEDPSGIEIDLVIENHQWRLKIVDATVAGGGVLEVYADGRVINIKED